MKLSNERTIELYPAQYEFVGCADRFTAFVGGIGSGKSHAGAVKALGQMSNPGLGMVVAPTYAMLRDATVRTFLELAGLVVKKFHSGEMRIELRNGAEALFRSADNPERLRGPNLSWAWIDEAALCRPGTWEIIIGRLREAGRAGTCWVTTTPKGRNWLYDRRGEMTLFKASTADNPYLDTGFVKSLQDAYTGQFARQELEGEFVTFDGLVYEEFDRELHVIDVDRKKNVRYVAGVDEGYTNPSVILVCGIDSDGRVNVAEEFYKRRMLQGDVVAHAQNLARDWNIEAFYVDPSAAGLIAEMASVGLTVHEANNAVMPGIQSVKARLAVLGDGRPRLALDAGCVNLAAEFESYSWKSGRAGIRDEPEKVNDHALDALRYVCMAVEYDHQSLFCW